MALAKSLPDGNTLNSVWCSSPTDVFAVGVNGTIKHYDGSTWSEIESGMKNNLNRVWNRVWGSSSSDVFAVGGSYDSTTQQSYPIILHYDGTSWSEMDAGITVGSLSGVGGSSSSPTFLLLGEAIITLLSNMSLLFFIITEVHGVKWIMKL